MRRSPPRGFCLASRRTSRILARHRPTDDKSAVTVAPPADRDHASAFLNIRSLTSRRSMRSGRREAADFLTKPKDHGREIRAYIRDPDGHLIEVVQTTSRPGTP